MDTDDLIGAIPIMLLIALVAAIIMMMHADIAPIEVGDNVYTSENYEYFEGHSFEGTVAAIHGSRCIITNESGVNRTVPAGGLLKENPIRLWRVSNPHLLAIR